MDANDAGASRKCAYSGASAEETFGYAQAVQIGDTIHVSGQLGLGADGQLAAPAPVGADGRPEDYSNMEEQMRLTYASAAVVLAQFGATLNDIVQETLYVLDVPSAFAVAGKVRKEAYATERPQVASNLIGVASLALAGQLIEIAFVAVRAA